MEKKSETTSYEIKLHSLPALCNKNLFSELSSLENNQFESFRLETSEIYIDESQNHKISNVISTILLQRKV